MLLEHCATPRRPPATMRWPATRWFPLMVAVPCVLIARGEDAIAAWVQRH
jgi:hypothetical protein